MNYNQLYMTKRKELLFDTKQEDFIEKMEAFTDEILKNLNNKMYANLLSDITIDIGSALVSWHVLKGGQITKVDCAKIIIKNIDLLIKNDYGDLAEKTSKEIECISSSNLVRLNNMTLSQQTNTYWGNDYASGLTDALRRGAILATTNPMIINNERKAAPEYWDRIKAEIKEENKGASPLLLAEKMTMKIVLKNAMELLPIFEATNHELGYVSLQVSPENSTNSDEMISEVIRIYEMLKQNMGTKPNVVFKLPAVKASVKAAREITQLGIGVNMTLSFTVSQHEAFARVLEEGKHKRAFVVMMSGRLDDRISDELMDKGVKGAKYIARFASEYIIKRSYNKLYKDLNLTKSAIMVASMRGPWSIEAGICDGTAPIYLTIFPDKRLDYDSLFREIRPCMDDKTDDAILNALYKSELFKKAYDFDGLKVEDFDEYYPVKITLDAFKASYREFLLYLAQ